jgi:arginine decarboxylase
LTELVNRKTSIACETDTSTPFLQRLESSRNDFKDSLTTAVSAHFRAEKVSFHTPGHKGREFGANNREGCLSLGFGLQSDVTELPGLDDLSAPNGVIQRIGEQASKTWNSHSSFLSVNGATAGLLAAVLTVSVRGQKLLVPRNAHRSVVNALVLSGLTPIWYEPQWDAQWQTYTGVLPQSIKELLRTESGCAGIVIVSPTYGGALSDVAALSAIAHEHKVPLIVDEAHGAHFVPSSGMPSSAIAAGADIVVHSLHKTLGALTQTGVIHIGTNSHIDQQAVQIALNLVQTSSPSYPLLLSIENTLRDISGEHGAELLRALVARANTFRERIRQIGAYDVYECGARSTGDSHIGSGCDMASVNPTHLLIAHQTQPASALNEALAAEGIFSETILGKGVLLMLGVGTSDEDIEFAISALQIFDNRCRVNKRLNYRTGDKDCAFIEHPARIEQMINPRVAATAPSHSVPTSQAENQIAAECIAPCPPGIPVCVPGQKLTKEVLNQIRKDQVRIVS